MGKNQLSRRVVAVTALVLIVLGLGTRVLTAWRLPLWVDEAESSINALTILEHGVPVSHYLGLPIYENTLSVPWPESEMYEFRDSSYSPRGVAVYHGWLPIYSIAAAQALAGFKPDQPQAVPSVQHGPESFLERTVVPRIPAILFSLGFMVTMFLAAREVAGPAAGLAALTWAALCERSALYGHQARYYSLTLLMSAVFIWIYFRVLRYGRTRDYCLLGLSMGLLFHTHQLSAVVAVAVAASGLYSLRQQPNWLRKGITSAAIAAVLIFPWIILSGLLESFANIPKAHELFLTWQDWIRYPLKNWLFAVTGLAALAVIVVVDAWERRRAAVRPLAGGWTRTTMLIAFGWIVIGLLAFHIVVPAASFFTGRLTLMLLTPYILLLSVATGLILRTIVPRFAPVAAVLGTVAFLMAVGELAKFPLGTSEAMLKVPAGLAALSRRTYEPGTLIFSSPNDHLVWTYYSGLPVQSIAPVRKSFLDQYAFPIVHLERFDQPQKATPLQIVTAAARRGQTVTPADLSELPDLLWRRQVIEKSQAAGMRTESPPVLPDFMDEVGAEVSALTARMQGAEIRYYRYHPMFAGSTFETPLQLWSTFFYRFVNPERRIGVYSNAYDRMRGSDVELVPAAYLSIYESPPRSASPSQPAL